MARSDQPCPIAPRIIPPAELDAIAVRIAAGEEALVEVALAGMAAAIWGMAGRLSKSRSYFREDLFLEGAQSCVDAFRRYDGRGPVFSYARARAWGIMRNLLTREVRNAQFMAPIPEGFEEELADDAGRAVDARLDLAATMDAADLTRKEAAVLRARYGLGGTKPLGCRSAGAEVKLSHWGVMLSERRAISKMRALDSFAPTT